jgi:hypothetical protein
MDAALALVLPRDAGLLGYGDGSEGDVSHYWMKLADRRRVD